MQDPQMIADQESPVDVVKAGLRQTVEHLMATTSVWPSGAKARPRILCAAATGPSRWMPFGVDHRQPAAKGIGDDQFGSVEMRASSRGQNGKSSRPRPQAAANDGESLRPMNVRRRDQRTRPHTKNRRPKPRAEPGRG